ncbi:DUF3450 domain-containing protein [Desulfosoma sp.]
MDLSKRPWVPLLLWCFLGSGAVQAAGDTWQHIEAPVRQSISTLKETQQQEEQWREEKEKLVARFEQLQQQQTDMKHRVAHLRQEIEAARLRVAAKEKQLADVEQIAAQIHPFLEELVSTLKARIAEDLPFLMTERRQRVERLEGLMNDPDVAISEKYRKVMEALQVEAEYGLTIETYQESISLDGQPLVVDIFRFGRLGLFFLSLDGRQGGFYDPAAGAWQPLSAVHKQALQTAIDIAAKRRPVELLSLPLGRLVVQ